MNEEYFLTELGIYLKVLPIDKKEEILATYKEVFQEGIANGQEEEMIAKSLGKPKDVASEILKKYDIPFAEKNIYKKGWEEIKPQKKEYHGPRFNKDYTTHSDEEYFTESPEEPYAQPQEKSSNTLIKLVLILFNFFVMIWVIIGLFFAFLAAWILVILLLCAPLLGVYLFLTLPISAGIFQLALTFVCFGVGLLGLAIGRSLTSLALRGNKNYWAFNRRIFKGGR